MLLSCVLQYFKEWVSALESFDKDQNKNKDQNNDIEFIVDITSTNGVKSFQDSIKSEGLSEKMKSITDSSICEHESFRGSIFLKE